MRIIDKRLYNYPKYETIRIRAIQKGGIVRIRIIQKGKP